jgi:hypothetical protein
MTPNAKYAAPKLATGTQTIDPRYAVLCVLMSVEEIAGLLKRMSPVLGLEDAPTMNARQPQLSPQHDSG